MNLSKDLVRNLLEEQGVKDPVMNVDESRMKALDSLLAEIPGNFSAIMVEDDLKYVRANLESLIYMTRGNAGLILCADPTPENDFKTTDINAVSDQIIEKAPDLVLMDFGMMLVDGASRTKGKEDIENDDKSFRGTDIVRKLRTKGHKGLVFGFSSTNTNDQRFMKAGADATVLKCDRGPGVFTSMQEIAYKISRLWG